MLCAVALSVAFPLRNYLEQRAELAAAVAAQQDLEQQRDELQARKDALLDTDYVAAEARRRLQYVTPGDTVFVVHAPRLARFRRRHVDATARHRTNPGTAVCGTPCPRTAASNRAAQAPAPATGRGP